jgi:hypothetical protein
MATVNPARLQRGQRLLAEQLQTLPRPDVCPCLLITWITDAHDAKNALKNAPQPQMDRCVGRTLDTVWEWVTRPRTDDELHAITSMECTCSLEERRTLDHLPGSKRISATNMAPGWRLVYDCLQPGAKADQEDVVRLAKFHRRKQWPRSICSFVPHGAGDTLQGVCQWLACSPVPQVRAAVFNSINRMMLILQPLILPYLIVSPTSLLRLDDLASQSTRSSLLEEEPRVEEEKNLSDYIGDCVVFFNVIQHLLFNVFNENMRLIFHHDNPAKLLEVYEGAHVSICRAKALVQKLQATGTPGSARHPLVKAAEVLPQVEGCLENFAHMLSLDFPELEIFEISKQRRPNLLHREIVRCPPPIDERLRIELNRFHNFQQCCAPACFKATTQTPLKVCLGCYWMRYCSRRCQKRAWSNPEVGHRHWCRAVRDSQSMITSSLTTQHVHAGGTPAKVLSAEDEANAALVLKYLDHLMVLKLQALNPGAAIKGLDHDDPSKHAHTQEHIGCNCAA